MRKPLLQLLFIALLSIAPLDKSGAAELIMFEQPGCEWCEQWDEDIGTVYDRTDEGRHAPLRRHDIITPLPEEYAFIKRIIYTPTFVLIDDGREVGRILGYPGEDHFWGLLGEMLSVLPVNLQATEAESPDKDKDI